MARLQAREPAAFEQLVRTHGGRMLAVARRLLHNEEDASDAVQDAFLSVFRAIGHFDRQSRLGTWLHRIAVNAALQKLRRKQWKPERSIEELLPAFQEDGHAAEPAVAWEEPHVALQHQETRDYVRRAIAELPENYRTVLVLRDIEELDTEETARLLALSAGTVKTRLHRARQALRTLLDRRLRGEVP